MQKGGETLLLLALEPLQQGGETLLVLPVLWYVFLYILLVYDLNYRASNSNFCRLNTNLSDWVVKEKIKEFIQLSDMPTMTLSLI